MSYLLGYEISATRFSGDNERYGGETKTVVAMLSISIESDRMRARLFRNVLATASFCFLSRLFFVHSRSLLPIHSCCNNGGGVGEMALLFNAER